MKYDPKTAYEILEAMEMYEGATAPSPLEALEEDTGTVPASRERPRKMPSKEEFDVNVAALLRKRQTPVNTHPDSWVGEMDYEVFRAHIDWMKQERLITADSSGHPQEILIKGVQLLKEVEAKGGWDKAMEVVAAANAATTLTSISEVLRKAKPKD